MKRNKWGALHVHGYQDDIIQIDHVDKLKTPKKWNRFKSFWGSGSWDVIVEEPVVIEISGKLRSDRKPRPTYRCRVHAEYAGGFWRFAPSLVEDDERGYPRPAPFPRIGISVNSDYCDYTPFLDFALDKDVRIKLLPSKA